MISGKNMGKNKHTLIFHFHCFYVILRIIKPGWSPNLHIMVQTKDIII